LAQVEEYAIGIVGLFAQIAPVKTFSECAVKGAAGLGRGLINAQPQPYRCKLDECEVVQFVF
jgi:hypothetical protein